MSKPVSVSPEQLDRLLTLLERQTVALDSLVRANTLLERQTRALEQIVETEQRRLAQVEDAARRAALRAGTAPAAIAAKVDDRMARWKK